MKKNDTQGDFAAFFPGTGWRRMLSRLTLAVCMIAAPLAASAQQQRVTMDLRDSDVRQVFREINRQTGLDFVYNAQQLESINPVSVEAKDQTVSSVLDKLLSGTPYQWTLERGSIVIKPRSGGVCQPVVVSGRVTDAAGNSLPGVTVIVKGTFTGTSTDAAGQYSLEVPAPGTSLQFSFIGMKPVEAAAAAGKPLDVVMHEEATDVEEVVVTGYYTLSGERSAGSYARISGSDLSAKASTGVIERLNGLIPGFTMNPAGEDKFLMRGVTSIESERAPLFVVDGMPIEYQTLESTVDPDDIESVTALKDATAASIWGARAANGVIVITTKRGRTDQPLRITYNGSIQLQGRPDFEYLDYMNARDYVDFAASVFDPSVSVTTYERTTPVEDILYKLHNGQITQSEADTQLDRLRNSDNLSQIKEYLYRPKLIHQHHLNFTGGGRNSAYYVTANYRNVRPQTKGSNEDRIIIDMKNDIGLARWINLSLGANLNWTQTTSRYTPEVVGMIPYEQLVDAAGNPASQTHMFYNQAALDYIGTELDARQMQRFDFRMLDQLDRERHTDEALNARLQAALTLKLATGLSFESRFQYQYGSGLQESIYDPDSFKVLHLRARQTPNVAGSVSRLPQGSIYDKTTIRSTDWVARNQFMYERTFADVHTLSALAGTEVRRYTVDTDNRIMYGYNQSNKTFTTLDQAELINGGTGGTITDPAGSTSQGTPLVPGFGTGILGEDRRFFSLYANAAYDYMGRYGLNASIRMDQANLFGTDARYKPIWSVGVLWNLHREAFMENVDVQRLSLRLSRGIAGNVPDSSVGGPYDIINYGSRANSTFAQTRPYVTLQSPALKRLSWEKTTITNVGVDFTVLRGRLFGSLDLYWKRTNDLIGSQIIDPTNGFATIKTNIGRMKNSGVELSLNSVNISTPDFRWNTTLNFSYNRNRVTDIYVDPVMSTYLNVTQPVFIQGYAAYSIFSYRWAGLDSNGEPTVYGADGKPTAASMSDVDALVYSGTAQPPYSGSLINTFTYKNLSLSVMAIYNLGHKLRNEVPGGNVGGNSNPGVDYLQGPGTFNAYPWVNPISNKYKGIWRKDGDQASTDVPRWLYSGQSRVNQAYYNAADINIIDGSYIYISDITLNYRFPEKWLSRVGMKGGSLTFNVTNPFCWGFNKEGIDPRYVSSMTGVKRSLRYGAEYMLKLNIEF